MNYDSEEKRKEQQAMAEKLKATREFLSNKENMMAIKKKLDEIVPVMDTLNAKVRRGEKLSSEEEEALRNMTEVVTKLNQSFEDMHLILGNNLMIQSDAIFFNAKKLAESGDEEAKKIYERLLPSYKKAHEPGREEMN